MENENDIRPPRPIVPAPGETGMISGTIGIDPYTKRPRHAIHIVPLSYGYSIQVGCASFALEKSEYLLQKLKEYLDDPDGTEKKYLDGQLFRY